MSHSTAVELLHLARQGLSATMRGEVDPSSALLAEAIEEFIVTGRDLVYPVVKAKAEDPELAKYLARFVRTVAAEEEVPAATDTWRLVLGGVGILIPPGFVFRPDQWAAAIEGLQSGLANLWSQHAHQVVVMPEPSPIESLFELSPQQVRHGLLQLFTDKWAEAFHLGDVARDDGWSAFVLPFVVALDVESAKQFVAGELVPKAPTLAMSGLKHRFESNFEVPGGGKTPFMLPPSGWAILFSFLRGMNFRKAVKEYVETHSEAPNSWTLQYSGGSVRLTNFKARVTREFPFPEETAADVRQVVSGPANQLGIPFLDERAPAG